MISDNTQILQLIGIPKFKKLIPSFTAQYSVSITFLFRLPCGNIYAVPFVKTKKMFASRLHKRMGFYSLGRGFLLSASLRLPPSTHQGQIEEKNTQGQTGQTISI